MIPLSKINERVRCIVQWINDYGRSAEAAAECGLFVGTEVSVRRRQPGYVFIRSGSRQLILDEDLAYQIKVVPIAAV